MKSTEEEQLRYRIEKRFFEKLYEEEKDKK